MREYVGRGEGVTSIKNTLAGEIVAEIYTYLLLLLGSAAMFHTMYYMNCQGRQWCFAPIFLKLYMS